MTFSLPKKRIYQILPQALRKASYFMINDRLSGKTSYVRRLSNSQFYPRFHLYVTETETDYKFDLHLDQKKPSYQGSRAHSGEYDEPIVEQEKNRILNSLS
jgi:hypothetical protein